MSADKDKTIDDLVDRASVALHRLDATVTLMQRRLGGERGSGS